MRNLAFCLLLAGLTTARVLMVHGYAQRTSNEWPAVGMSVPAWPCI